jgi:RNA polymerase sigma-54 factor
MDLHLLSRVNTMPLLQPRLNLKVSQRQMLTPGLMQMVSVLALNKMELAEMIQNEIAENPLLEEMDESIPMLDEVEQRESARELIAQATEAAPADPFEEIDFGNYFQEYLDPGFRSQREFEEIEKPGFEQFLSRPTSLFDHLQWQLGAQTLVPEVAQATEFLIGNLDENGYLASSLDDLIAVYAVSMELSPSTSMEILAHALQVLHSLDPAGIGARSLSECLQLQVRAQLHELDALYAPSRSASPVLSDATVPPTEEEEQPIAAVPDSPHHSLHVAVQHELQQRRHCFELASVVLQNHFALLTHRDPREIAKALACTPAEATEVLTLIRSLDPRPGTRYSSRETQWIEPDVVFVKRDEVWVARRKLAQLAT